MITPQQLSARIESLPVFSSTALRALELLQRPNTTDADLEGAMRHDPSLTANVLKIANSAFYRGRQDVFSIKQAVGRLGRETIGSITASLAFARVLPDLLPGYEMPSNAVWRHSVAVAIFSQHIADRTGVGANGAAFTAGLLHDIGKLAIGAFLNEHRRELERVLDSRHETSFIEAEKTLLGVDHCEAGYALAVRWELPPMIAAAARYHHTPAEAPAGEAGMVARVVHVANGMAHLFGYGADVGGMRRRLESNEMMRLGMNLEVMQRVLSETFDNLQRASALVA